MPRLNPHSGHHRGSRLVCMLLVLAAAVLWRGFGTAVPNPRPANHTGNSAGAANAPAQHLHQPAAVRPTPLDPIRQPAAPAPPAQLPSTATGPEPPLTWVVASTVQRTTLRFELPANAYTLDQHQLRGRPVSVVRLANHGDLLKQAGYPALPVIRRDVIIPLDTVPELAIEDLETIEIACAPPLPSAGFVSRGKKLAGAPDFSAFYAGSELYPAQPAQLTAAYMLRHVRGAGVVITPFQYDAGRGVLRVVTAMTVHVATPASGDITARDPAFPAPFQQLDFADMAARRFANADASFSRNRADIDPADSSSRGAAFPAPTTTSATDSPGHLLLIAADDLLPALDTFIAWKQQRGIQLIAVGYPSATGGTGRAALQTYIQSQYDSHAITHVILVGDAEQIPVYQLTPHPSDTLYTLVSGADAYHDLFISRICATTEAEVRNQTAKLIAYEQQPDLSDDASWYEAASMVGSNEGDTTSTFGYRDRELLELERIQLLDYGYTHIDQIYDPGASVNQVLTAWNEGRSLLYYLGHGLETSWGTTGFSTSSVHASLANGNRQPFVINGNCQNGNFTRNDGDCLAEAMLKAGSSAAAAGAIGALGATTDMDWDPPIVMIRGFSDYLVAETLESAGGAAFFSIQYAMDYCYNTATAGEAAAQRIMQQTHLFGDCTLGLRTRRPDLLTVTTSTAYIEANTAFTVNVTNAAGTPVQGAVACLYRAADPVAASELIQLTARTDASGQAVLTPAELGSATLLTLTVYERNAAPYQAEIPVNDGSLLIYSSSEPAAVLLGEPYSFTHLAAGGTAPYTWSISAGGAPWLALDTSTGAVGGTPTAAGTLTYSVQVSDSMEATVTQAITLQIGTAVHITSATLPDAQVSQPYDCSIATTGTFTPITFTLAAGSLPPGISLSPAGTLQGTPSLAGTFTFDVTATDTQQQTATAALQITITPADTISISTGSTLATAMRLTSYSQTFTASGGTGSGFVWSLLDGTLPPGLTLQPGGTLTGTPSAVGTFNFTLGVHDDASPAHHSQRSFTLAVESAVYFTTTTLMPAQVGTLYDAIVPVAGSYPPFTYSTPYQTRYDYTTAASSTFVTSENMQSWVGDELEWELALGFAFPFYDATYTTCRIGDNGYIVFGATSPEPKWNASRALFETQIMIAPFWTDLVITADYPDTGIGVDQQADSVSITWSGRDYHVPEETINFSVTLHRDGNITYRYGSITTTNRVIVGISDGAGRSSLLYEHLWTESAPDYVTGWDKHADIVFQPVPWLQLLENGHLVGTPPAISQHMVTIAVQDAMGNTATAELSLAVGTLSPADLNQDGDINNAELLSFLERWHNAELSKSAVEQAIALWRGGGAGSVRGSAAEPSSGSGAMPALARTGEIRILEFAVATAAEIDALLRAGYDVANRSGLTLTVYATPEENLRLAEAGYSCRLVGTQWVGTAPPVRSARSYPPPGYPDFSQITAMLQQHATAYSSICTLQSIGQSVQGRDIWAVRLSANVALDEDEPEVNYVASLHGDEPLGTVMCLRLIELLLANYGGSDATGQQVSALLDNTDIWIVPLMNPDGYQLGTRYNANGIDLNRNFPDGVLVDLGTLFQDIHLDSTGLEPEVAALAAWSAAHNFVLSMSLHTGSLLVCYPYGNNAAGIAGDTPTVDDALFKQLSRTYAHANPDIAANAAYPDGIINGATWYPVPGELADWSYRYLGTFATTAELAEAKAPESSTLDQHWQNNAPAMLAYLEAAHQGIRGVVTDAASGQALEARLTPIGIDHAVYTDPPVGDYQRLLQAGTYALETASAGYWVDRTEAIVVTSGGSATRHDVQLRKAPYDCQRTFRSHDGASNLARVQLGLNCPTPALPSAVIVSEILPAGWTYSANSSLDSTAATLPEPRLDGRTCSWLLWDDAVIDQTFTYQAVGPTDVALAHFDGRLETVQGDILTGGAAKWTRFEPLQCTLELVAGWNLFSLSCLLPDMSVAAVLTGIPEPVVWSYDGQHYQQTASLATKRGYWLYCQQPYSLTLNGYRDPDPWHDFSSGWNLFGALYNRTLPSPAPFLGPVWEWQQRYEPAQQLQVLKGYWGYLQQPIQTDFKTLPQ